MQTSPSLLQMPPIIRWLKKMMSARTEICDKKTQANRLFALTETQAKDQFALAKTHRSPD